MSAPDPQRWRRVHLDADAREPLPVPDTEPRLALRGEVWLTALGVWIVIAWIIWELRAPI